MKPVFKTHLRRLGPMPFKKHGLLNFLVLILFGPKKHNNNFNSLFKLKYLKILRTLVKKNLSCIKIIDFGYLILKLKDTNGQSISPSSQSVIKTQFIKSYYRLIRDKNLPRFVFKISLCISSSELIWSPELITRLSRSLLFWLI